MSVVSPTDKLVSSVGRETAFRPKEVAYLGGLLLLQESMDWVMYTFPRHGGHTIVFSHDHPRRHSVDTAFELSRECVDADAVEHS